MCIEIKHEFLINLEVGNMKSKRNQVKNKERGTFFVAGKQLPFPISQM